MQEQLRIAVLEPGLDQAFDDLAEDARANRVELVSPAKAGFDLGHCDGLITGRRPLTGEELRSAGPRLRHVQVLGRHFDHIDWKSAVDLGITVGSHPRKGAWTVAEMALTFVMALSKQLLDGHEKVAAGAYRDLGLEPKLTSQRSHSFQWMKLPLRDVHGSTVGIIGMGEIGAELAVRLQPLGVRTLYYKRTPLSADAERAFGVSYAGFNELLAASDFVVVAVPQTDETEGLIDAAALAAMSEDAYLINICRGAVVDEGALVKALRERRIRGAGLDVFVYEPLPADHPLTRLDNVLLAPHIGGGTGTKPPAELWAGVEQALVTLRQGVVRFPIPAA
ncbi:MAG: NAD(P)-dependent oxidoreductase [Thermaerobacterales bacterium]